MYQLQRGKSCYLLRNMVGTGSQESKSRNINSEGRPFQANKLCDTRADLAWWQESGSSVGLEQMLPAEEGARERQSLCVDFVFHSRQDNFQPNLLMGHLVLTKPVCVSTFLYKEENCRRKQV